LPVFPVRNPQQIQVQLLDAVGTFSADGQPLDYRSELTIYRNGEEVMRCTSTVNSPCTYDGYRFHQVGYFGFGAAVQVRDLSSGNVIYSETLALSGRAPSPHVLIKDATGGTVLDQTVPLTEDLNAGDISYRGALVSLPDGRLLTVGLQDAGAAKQRLAVLEAGSAPRPIAMLLDEGQAAAAGGLQVTYVKQSMTPSAVVADMPLPPDAGGSATGQAQLQLSNVVYGTDKTSAGTTAGEVSGGPALLTLSGLSPQPLALRPGQSAQIGGYQYTFLGQREFAGIQVKRDRSDYVVWAGATLIVLGLMITFWVPRRRLWAKISSAGTQLAGQAASHARYTRELAALAREAGAGVSEETEDDA